MRRAVVVAAVIGGLGGLSACSACSTSTAPDAAVPRDAGPDAGPRDAGRDAGTRDAGRDAALPDGGEPGWAPFAFLPSECEVARAMRPAALSPIFHWEPCFDGRAGCENLIFTEPTVAQSLGMTHHDGSSMRGRVTRAAGRFLLQLLVGEDGSCFGAWRSASAGRCSASFAGFGEGFAAVQIDLGDTSAPDEFRYLYAEEARIGSATEPVATFPLVGGALFPDILGTSVTHSLIAFSMSPGGVARIRPGLGFDMIAPSGGRIGVFSEVAAVGRDIFYGEWGSTHVRWWLRTPDDRDVPFIAYDDSEVFRLKTDGRDLVWNRAFGWTPSTIAERVEIWTAAFTTDPAALVPRRVITLPRNSTGGYLWHGWGYAASDGRRPIDGVAIGTEIWLVRLSDGARWTLTAPAGYRWEPQWLGPTDFGMSVREYASGNYRTTFRIRYDSLGPPDA